MSRILLENVTKKYGETVAISQVTMEIDDGSFVVILGPSGCGKTTLLRCIAGLETPDTGSISIDDEVVNDVPPRERDLSMVFQNYALFTHMSVADNIAFPLRVRNKPATEIANRVNEIAKFLGIENLLAKLPLQLSGGEQQRVAIARAIVREPKAFLMDEPLSNLDAPLRAYMRTELKRIQREFSITTVYVTHDQLEALALGTRMGVMNKGGLLQYDRPEVVYSRPAQAFVAGFVGNPPANLVDVSVVEVNGRRYLEAPALKYPLSEALASKLAMNPTLSELTMAIRPEDIRCSKSPLPEPSYNATVYSIEPMGPATVLDVMFGGRILKATVPAQFDVKVDDAVWFTFGEDRIHIFDRTSGMLAA